MMRCAPLLLLAACQLAACQIDATTAIRNAPEANLTDGVTAATYGAFADPAVLYDFILASARPAQPGPCPIIDQAGDKTFISGGCSAGTTRYFGSVEITGSDLHYPERIDFIGYGTESDEPCETNQRVNVRSEWNGSVIVKSTGDAHDLDIDLIYTFDARRAGCELETKSYAALYTAVIMGGPEKYVANGGGTLLLDRGTVEIVNNDVTFDATACGTQPLSGTSILRSDGHTVAINYLGESACDPNDKLATWTLDGAEQGAIDLSLCAASRPELGGWIALGVLAARALRRPRRQA